MTRLSIASLLFVVEMSTAFFPPCCYRSRVEPLFRTIALFSAQPEQPTEGEIKPDILVPFLAAADPMYYVQGPIGQDEFVISRAGEPTKEELSNENLLRIVKIECSDLEVNTLVWKCLGYRFDEQNQAWTSEKVFPKWREKFPIPPDFIGMRRDYSKEIDQPSLKSNQSLVKSVPVDSKQSLKRHFIPLGFKGYKMAELTPNKTRRAQCTNWLLYFREELFGFTIEELKERRRVKKESEDNELDDEGAEAEPAWKPPVSEVF